jgi:hypothetical protein
MKRNDIFLEYCLAIFVFFRIEFENRKYKRNFKTVFVKCKLFELYCNVKKLCVIICENCDFDSIYHNDFNKVQTTLKRALVFTNFFPLKGNFLKIFSGIKFITHKFLFEYRLGKFG